MLEHRDRKTAVSWNTQTKSSYALDILVAREEIERMTYEVRVPVAFVNGAGCVFEAWGKTPEGEALLGPALETEDVGNVIGLRHAVHGESPLRWSIVLKTKRTKEGDVILLLREEGSPPV